MSWFQLSVEVRSGEIPATLELLNAMGALATTQQNAGEDSYFDLAHPAEPGWDRQKITGLFEGAEASARLAESLRQSLEFIDRVEVQALAERDWETAWLDQYRPIEITPKLWVFPSWVTDETDAETVIRIDPGMAFGTGTHETTRLCMQLLAASELNGLSVLDYGCGSGILAITALKLGAACADGVDIDPKAEQVARENARINGVECRFTIQSADSVSGRQYDVVIANILAFALVDLAPVLSACVRNGGSIVLSGILRHQARDVMSAYQKEFQFEQLEHADWVALLGVKTKT